MDAISTYLATKWLNHTLRNDPYTSPGTSIYVSAYTSSPEDDDSEDELPALYAYARVQATAWNDPVGEGTKNSGSVSFPVASGGNWGLITHLAVHDALTAGNLLYHGPMDASRQINDGDQLVIPAEQLGIELA